MYSPLLERIEEIYRESGLSEATITAYMGYCRAVHENAQLSLELAAIGEEHKGETCLRIALAQLAVLCGGAPGVAL